MSAATIVVLAKAPRPGGVKTRLCPPCTPAQAAQLASAALHDTLAAVRAAPAGGRRVLALDGPTDACAADGFEVIAQRGDGLGERLAAAFADVGTPALLVGMDTPQLTPALLVRGVRALERADAVIGPALDGGYWAIGFRRAAPGAFSGVAMSSASTLAQQRVRLGALGLTVAELPALRDVDDFADARAVAGDCPRSAFANALVAVVRGS